MSIFITSPGRCGMHWLGWMLRDLLGLEKITIKPSMKEDPAVAWQDMIAYSVGMEILERKGQHIFMQHPPLEFLAKTEHLWKIICLVRDPRDTAISAAYYCYHRWETLERIERNWGVPTMYPSWEVKEYIAHFMQHGLNHGWWESYARNFGNVRHFTVRYEDLLRHTEPRLGGLIKTLGYWDIPASRVKATVEGRSFSSFANGRIKGEENPAHHYRKGIVGDWKNYFSDEQNHAFCEKYHQYMGLFQYTEEGVS